MTLTVLLGQAVVGCKLLKKVWQYQNKSCSSEIQCEDSLVSVSHYEYVVQVPKERTKGSLKDRKIK